MTEARHYSRWRFRRVLGGRTPAARTIEEVTDEWNRRSGQNITRARVWQILRRAEQKLADVLRAERLAS